MRDQGKRPLIGIVPTYHFEQKMLQMPARYVRAVVQAGGAPLVLPFTTDVSVYDVLLPSLDGFLLSGGQDISPVRYGGDITYGKMSELSPSREEVEYLILSFARQYDVPVLGICRGMQMMNVSFGGTLYQDIDEQFLGGQIATYGTAEGRKETAAEKQVPEGSSTPEAAGQNPYSKPEFKSSHWQEVDYHLPTHTVSIVARTKLAHILGVDEVAVNSMHHQGVKDLGMGLQACAFDPAGLVEAIEAPDLRFMVGVQWHPEFFVGDGPMQPLFEALVNEAANPGDRRPHREVSLHIKREERGGRFPDISFDEVGNSLDSACL